MGKFKKHWRETVLLILIASNTAVWLLIWQAGVPRVLTVAFLDIGQGDAIYIEAPNGNQALIDGGPGRAVLRALGEIMPWPDKTLDVVIATHPDADHLGGLPAVLEHFQVLGVMDNGQPSATGYYEAWDQAKKEEARTGARVLLARRGERIILAPDVYFDILHPAGRPRH